MNIEEIKKIAGSTENSKIRAEIWGDFVGWSGRRRGENGILVTQLKKHDCQKVLDVALGDGVDTIYLLQQGFEVEPNEIDMAFREKAIENAKKNGFDIKPTDLDWRDLSQKYEPESFDSIICMGNSLTCVFGEENQKAVLKEFYKLLRPKGILIIDERNFQKILDNKQDALSGKLHSSGKQLYTGTDKVGAKFVAVTDDLVAIEYTHYENKKKAYYVAYPFRESELESLIKLSGFSRVEKYSDYEPGENSHADFFQYVCVK